MKQIIDSTLEALASGGNLRVIPADACASERVDLSSNDYLGIAAVDSLRDEFFASADGVALLMSASASRLLGRSQRSYEAFEHTLSEAYGGRSALLFNSGYHANTGIVSAFAGTNAHIIADKLVHASIIDGIKLSGLPFDRFRHNDIGHLDRLAAKAVAQGRIPLIIAESVYSMDGDRADIRALVEVKKRYPGSMLYIDEAHAVGVEGPAGLGLAATLPSPADADIVVGTLGKALASAGAFAITAPEVRSFLVNRARSLIFSTALPPITAEWSRFIFLKAMGMDSCRAHLKALGHALHEELSTVGSTVSDSHIQPLLIGSPDGAVAMSGRLREHGFDVLPIRTPTVPPGTDRLRFSLSAALDIDTIRRLGIALRTIYGK